MNTVNYSLLKTIDSPGDLRLLSPNLLEQVASELRSYLIDTVSQNGGHFAAGLGAVELAVTEHGMTAYGTLDLMEKA
jgi:1-deoxy-D-xylulose-5-phosphate synthase